MRNDVSPIHIDSNQNDGSFIVILNKGTQYDISVSCPGYTFFSTNIDCSTLDSYKEKKKNIELEPLRVGAKIILNNMYFPKNKYDLLKESKYELNRAISLMNENPSMKIEISGHTDTHGLELFNMHLSRQRAQSVIKYLISHGISSTRLTAIGYGPNKPIASNKTEEGRAETVVWN